MDQEELSRRLSDATRFSSLATIEKLTDSNFKVADDESGRRYAVKVIDHDRGRGSRGIIESKLWSRQLSGFVQPVIDII